MTVPGLLLTVCRVPCAACLKGKIVVHVYKADSDGRRKVHKRKCSNLRCQSRELPLFTQVVQ